MFNIEILKEIYKTLSEYEVVEFLDINSNFPVLILGDLNYTPEFYKTEKKVNFNINIKILNKNNSIIINREIEKDVIEKILNIEKDFLEEVKFTNSISYKEQDGNNYFHHTVLSFEFITSEF